MSISERNDKSDDVASVRRLEIFTGVGRRRAWTAEQKAAIVAESVEDGGRVTLRLAPRARSFSYACTSGFCDGQRTGHAARRKEQRRSRVRC